MSRASNLIVKPLKNNRRGRKVNDTPERMIRRFTRKVKKAGILNEVRRRRYYRKPSDERHWDGSAAAAHWEEQVLGNVSLVAHHPALLGYYICAHSHAPSLL